MPKLDKSGRIEFDERDKDLGQVWMDDVKDTIISYLGKMAAQPKAKKLLMSLEMNKEYPCHNWGTKKGRYKECEPMMLLSHMLNHYMTGWYELNRSGKLVQDIIKSHSL